MVFPLLCVPINTLASNLIGIPLGRTELNRNLPSKTVEGYIGGLLLTCIWAYFVKLTLLIPLGFRISDEIRIFDMSLN